MQHWAGIIAAVVPLFVALGGGVGWLWSKIEKRFLHIEEQLEECRSREADSRVREAESKARRAHQLTVIELLWQEVTRLSASDNPVLVRAKKLLDDLKSSAKDEG